MKKTLLISLATFAIAASAQAATIIGSYQFPGADINELTAFTTAGNSTNANVTMGELIAPSNGVFTATGSTTRWVASWSSSMNATSLATAIDKGSYISFSLGANSGYEMNLNGGTVQIDLGRYGTAVNGANMASLMFEATGFTSSDYAIAAASLSGTVTFSISSTALSALQGEQEFRLYFWNSDGTGRSTAVGGLYISQDVSIGGLPAGENILVSGTVSAIPEPSTVAAVLGGIAVLALICKRRNH